MLSLDFASARLHHMNWRLRLRSYIAGQSRISEEELVSPHECALGKWLDETGMPAYGSVADMHELCRVHQELHRHSADIVKAVRAGLLDQAKAGYALLEPLTDRILHLLTEMEAQVKQREQVA